LEETAIVKESNQQPREKQPPLMLGVSGLGGWLILVQIGLYLTILLNILTLNNDTLPAFSPGTWEMLTSKDSSWYDSLWAPLLIFELVVNILLILVSLFCLYNMYQKKSIFPKLMIIVYSLSLFIVILEYILINQISIVSEYGLSGPDDVKDIVRAAITCAIWIPYFLKSERVQNTFIQ